MDLKLNVYWGICFLKFEKIVIGIVFFFLLFEEKMVIVDILFFYLFMNGGYI